MAKKCWFGKGNFFGMPIFPLRVRLEEIEGECCELPLESLIKRHYHSGRTGVWKSKIFKDILCRKINDGSLKSSRVTMLSLFGIIDQKIRRNSENIYDISPYQSPPNNLNADKYNRGISDPGSIFHLYYHLIENSNSDASIDHLLVAANSNFAVLAERIYEGPKERHETPGTFYTKKEIVEVEKNYSYNALQEMDVTYYQPKKVSYSQEVEHSIVKPFADLAKSRIKEITKKIKDQDKFDIISKKLKHCNEAYRSTLKKTYRWEDKACSINS
ncbi:hypothetical protein GF336_01575 [Candidatus Woesearchaeota archaeon]|nr:hypothetical protein [Candidatus Woesearchaeota archaeon]